MDKPIYQWIYDTILDEISNLNENDMIESERDLSERLGVSRMTVRKSVENLCSDGYLYRLKNKGTYVANPDKRKKTFSLGFCSAEPTDFVLMGFNIKFGSKEVSRELKIDFDTPYYRIVRKNIVEDIVVSVEEIYLNKFEFDNNYDVDFKNIGNINSLKNVSNVVQTFSAEIAPDLYGVILNAVGKSVLVVKSVVTSYEDKVLVFSRHYINSNVYEVSFTM